MPPSSFPLVCAVVPAFNRRKKTLHFLRQFSKIEYPNKRVVVCDDGSSDHTFESIRQEFPDVDVLRGDGNLWWSGATNLAARHALAQGADYILTINDDCVMEPKFLTEMVRVAQKNPKYIVGCRIHREDQPEFIWSLGTLLVFKRWEIFALRGADRPWTEFEGKLLNPLPTATMPGNGVLIPRTVFEAIGFYDQKNLPQYHADSDFVLRAAKAGYLPVIALDSILYNHIRTEPLVKTRWEIIFSRKSERYWRAYGTILKRHGPFGKRIWLLLLQYVPFFAPNWAVRLYHKIRDLRSSPRRARITSETAET